VRPLGTGGYAEVMLYDQALPARKVAVKVMKEAALSAEAVARFAAEANAMAQLEHPHIVPVYSVGTTPDNRQYIVMMYYPRPNLSQRVKTERLSVAEVLRIGIQIGSAVETAHRAGILHRDIKPANILTNQYGTPGLTDFGIAGQASAKGDDVGVSVPWSPPEVLYATAPASIRSDIYSMASTLWHLLVGRSPFEIVGGDNSAFALMKRIRDNPPPATGRPDVPPSLEALLRAGMSQQQLGRPATMLEFLRSLQSIEQELRLQPTPAPLPEQLRIDSAPLNRNVIDATRVKAAQVVAAPEQLPPSVAAGPPQPVDAPPELKELPDEEDPKFRWGVALIGVVAVVLIVGLGWWLSSAGPGVVPEPPVTATVTPPGILVGPPTGIKLEIDPDGDTAYVKWYYDQALDDDQVKLEIDGLDVPLSDAEIQARKKEWPYTKGMCAEIRILRADGSGAEVAPVKKCHPAS
jgi:serine/threonine protein kinase